MDDKQIRRRQKKTIGAQFPISSHESGLPDAGNPIPEEQLIRCERCGIEQHGWTGGNGFGIERDNKIYCCDSCAKNQDCDCIAEAERHTSLNLAKSETNEVPPKPI